METFQRILKANEEVGSAEGGDQGVLNNGFCPQWNAVAGGSDPDCGRLPWIFNVQAAHYETFKTLRQMSNLREPAIVHFVSDGKPWRVLAMDYQQIPFSEENVRKLSEQRVPHLLWRQAFFSGTKEKNVAPPAQSVLFEGQQGGMKQGAAGARRGKLPTEMTLDESGGAQSTFRKSSARAEPKKVRDEEMDVEEEVQRSRKKSSKKSTKNRKSSKNSSSKKSKNNKFNKKK
jgi:lipopolysaccharide biosynthesis glycosyltransferase